MRTALRIAAVVLLASSVTAQTANPPYAGRWKLNTAKSDFGQLTATYEAVAGGGFKVSMDGVSYTFTTDGKEVTTPWGTMQSVKAVNATTWQSTNKVNGKLFSTDTITLSADGKTLTVESKVVQPAGGTADNTMTFTRASGGPGLAGTWKAAKMSSNAPGLVDIAVKGANGIVFKFVDQGATCDGAFDGKPHPATGAMFPTGWTCTFSKSGANGFSVAFNKDGKPMYGSTFTVSADGKTMTEVGGAVNTKEKIKAIYEKQ
jgi:hypothetical protein